MRQELDAQRLQAAKVHILTEALSTATPPEVKSYKPGMPSQPKPSDSLLNLLVLLPSLLDTENPLPPSTISLLLASPPLSELEALLPELTAIVSSSIHTSALSLTRIAHPTTNPSYLHRHVSSLPRHVAGLQDEHRDMQLTLANARLRTLATLISLLESHVRVLAALVRTLETKHGVVARNLELRAAEAAARAQRTEADAEQALAGMMSQVYTPDAVRALKNYAAHLRDAKIRTEERIRGVKAELSDYGVGVEGGEGKEKMMREMGRVYRQMGRQIQETKGDLDRLQRH